MALEKKPFGWSYRHKSSIHWNLHVGETFDVSLRFPDSFEIVPLYKEADPSPSVGSIDEEELQIVAKALEPYVTGDNAEVRDIKAKAAAVAEEALREKKSIRGQFFYPIVMPLTKDGIGPAAMNEVDKLSFEVWDQYCTSHASFDHLPSAVDLANVLNTAFQKLQVIK